MEQNSHNPPGFGPFQAVKRTKSVETQRMDKLTTAHNPEVGGSSPPPATMLSDQNRCTHLKPLRDQGFQPFLPSFFNARFIDTRKRKIAEDLSPCGKIGVKRQEGERS